MTAPPPLGRVRRRLLTIAVLSAVLWALALGAAAVAALNLAGRDARPLALLLSAGAAGVVLWRWRGASSIARVALWLEEHEPALGYALVTRLEARYAGVARELDEQIAAVPLNRPLTRAWQGAVLPAAAGAALGLLALAVASSDVVAGRAAAVRATAAVPALPSSLAAVTVRIEPPRYAGDRPRELRDPEAIRALAGSRIIVQGRSPAVGVGARLGDQPLSVSGGEWRTSFVMPLSPRALRLVDSIQRAERVIVVEPVPDESPRAVLTAPRRDTLLRSAPATIAVAAEVSDDLGLAEAVIEYMVSSGGGETFTARVGRVDARALRGRSARLGGTLTNSVLRLGPGDVLSIRAVARDRNSVSGPGIGVSETRTLRIARPDEDDWLAVEAIAPVFGDSALLSQRMILRLTEALVRALHQLSRDSVVQRASAIASDQERLRDRVHSLVFPGHEHADESPLAGEPPDHAEPADPVNADLKEAYDAMWEAGRELRIASPQTALAPMRVALAALDRARLADRVYLRGGVPRVVLDVDRVRLTGDERGLSSARPPRAAVDTVIRSLAERLWRITADTTADRLTRLNALSELRVELLSVSPRAAAAVASATAALRSGRDPRPALRTAVSDLVGDVTVRETAVPWSVW